MSKELPFFKFNPTEWLVGKISYQSLEIQGAFMQCCAIYWKNSGFVKVDQIDWKIGKNNLESLITYDFVSVDPDGFMNIEFLEEQLISFQGIRQKRAEIGALGGVAKANKNLAIANNNIPIANQNLADYRHKTIDKDKDKELKAILNNSLLSEIKISDDKLFFIINDLKIETNEQSVSYFEIARKFQLLFIKNLKEKESPYSVQEKANYKNYIPSIRIMIEKENVTIENLRDAYNFLNSKEGDFWKPNILSTSKLREQISQLLIRKKTAQNGSKPETTSRTRNR